MNRPILNLADVELLPRPPQFAPKGAAAERYDARVGNACKYTDRGGVVMAAALAYTPLGSRAAA